MRSKDVFSIIALINYNNFKNFEITEELGKIEGNLATKMDFLEDLCFYTSLAPLTLKLLIMPDFRN